MTVRGMTPGLVAEVAREIDERRGARVRTVHQDGPLRFRLDLRGTEREDLVIDLGAPFPRVHLAAPRAAPKSPTPLAGALRRVLAGTHLEAAVATPGERALVLRLRAPGEALSLWVELFGGQANLYVVAAGDQVLLTPRGEVARRREASKGMRFLPAPARPEDAAAPLGGSAAVRTMAADAAGARETGSALVRLRRFVKQALRAALSARTLLETALGRELEADEHHAKGELLRGAFHLLQPGMDRVRIPDYTRDPPVEVELELDPRLAPGEQIAACFRRERKCRRAAAEARARLGAGSDEVEALEAARIALERALDDALLAAVVDALPARLRKRARRALEEPEPAGVRKEPARAAPWHTYVSRDGWRILVGRDARGNDELTLRHAAPGDLFLHVRGATGSHVVVPTPKGKSVPRDTLLDAAELACHFSERRAAEHNEVDHTPRRHVRKPRGAPPGLVRLERCKTLTLRRDEGRRARLLASRQGPGTRTAPG